MCEANPSVAPSAIFADVTKVCPVVDRDTFDIITIVIDERHLLGKDFNLLPNGTVQKKSAVAVARGLACQYYVPDLATLQEVLRLVSDNPHAAIINAGFQHAAIGEQFLFLSKTVLESMGLESNAVSIVEGMTAFARLKELAKPSTWQLFDRDEDAHTPEWARNQSPTEWRQSLDKILPGVAKVKMLRAHSSSARVLLPDGSAAGGGNGHVWIKIKDATDSERTRTAIMARALELNLAWPKPRISKLTGLECGRAFATIVDSSVWTAGRLIFAGRPTCSATLKIAEQQFEIIDGEDDILDTSYAFVSPLNTYRASARHGVPLRLSRDGAGYSSVMHNLNLDTEIELENGSVQTVRDLLPNLTEKVRCQAPFRASSSMAAFIALDNKADPFVFDSGTNTRHVLAKSVVVGNLNKDRGSLIYEVKSRLGKLIGVDNVEAVFDEQVLSTAWDATFCLPTNSKLSVLNRNDELVELSVSDIKQFGLWRSFGHLFHTDLLEEVIEEKELSDADNKALRVALAWLEHGPLIENLKLYKQAKSLDIKVDMFAKRGSLTVADGVASITLPHRRFVPKEKYEKHIVEPVVDDYILHFPEFVDFLAFVLHARFATDRRHAFVWLHSPSSWGKGFLLTIFAELGLVVEVQAAEIEKAMAGSPVGLSLPDMLRSWILFVDEFKAASSELKLLNRQMSISPKNQLRCSVQLYTKVFASAENVRSLVGDGVESQFNNRFAYLSPITLDQKLEDRPLFKELGKAVYVGALVNYVAEYLNERVDHLREMGCTEASKMSDNFIENYQFKHRLNTTFGDLDDSVDDIVDELRNCLAEYARWTIDLTGAPDSVQGLGPRLLTTLKRTASVGYVSEGDRSKHRRHAIVLAQPVQFIKSYLALSEDRSTIGKMQYKVEEIAKKLHMRAEHYSGKVRVYEPDTNKGDVVIVKGPNGYMGKGKPASKDVPGVEKIAKRGVVVFIDSKPADTGLN